MGAPHYLAGGSRPSARETSKMVANTRSSAARGIYVRSGAQKRFDHPSLAVRIVGGKRVFPLDLHHLVHDAAASFKQCEKLLVDRIQFLTQAGQVECCSRGKYWRRRVPLQRSARTARPCVGYASVCYHDTRLLEEPDDEPERGRCRQNLQQQRCDA